jgi:hypothetical protein
MGTKKQAKIEKARKKYGDCHHLYIFEWKDRPAAKVSGTIGSVPANDLKTAVKRLLKDLDRLDHRWHARLIRGLIKNKKLSKYVGVTKIELKKPVVYIPAEVP